jgi:hypothetical protein
VREGESTEVVRADRTAAVSKGAGAEGLVNLLTLLCAGGSFC